MQSVRAVASVCAVVASVRAVASVRGVVASVRGSVALVWTDPHMHAQARTDSL